MKKNLLKLTALALLPAALFTLASCSSTGVESTTTTATEKGVPGGAIVETHKITATVAAVDAASRHVTLATADGTKTTLKAGPEVVNFNQIQVGDQVKVLVAEQLVAGSDNLLRAVAVRFVAEPVNEFETPDLRI